MSKTHFSKQSGIYKNYLSTNKNKIILDFEQALKNYDVDKIKSMVKADNLIESGNNTKLPLTDNNGVSILTQLMFDYPDNERKRGIFAILLTSRHIDINASCKCNHKNIISPHNIITHALSDMSLAWAAKLLINSYDKIDLNAKFTIFENSKKKEYNILLYLIENHFNQALTLLLDNEETSDKEQRLDYDSDAYGNFSPLLCAIKFGNNEALKLLMNKKSSKYSHCVVNINKMRNNITPYEYAISENNQEAIRIIDKPFSINESNHADSEKDKIILAFKEALKDNDVDKISSMVKADNLIESGKNTRLALTDNNGKSILTQLMFDYPDNEKKREIFAILLTSRHIDINASCKCNHKNIISPHNIITHALSDMSLAWAAKLLINSYDKIDLNAKFTIFENSEKKEYNILLYLIENHFNQALTLLLDNEETSDKEQRLDYDSDAYGDFSPLLCAIKFGNNEALKLLMNKYSNKGGYCVIDINKKRNNMTPYEYAMRENNRDAARIIDHTAFVMEEFEYISINSNSETEKNASSVNVVNEFESSTSISSPKIKAPIINKRDINADLFVQSNSNINANKNDHELSENNLVSNIQNIPSKPSPTKVDLDAQLRSLGLK